MKNVITIITIFTALSGGFSQIKLSSVDQENQRPFHLFLGYELGEMAFNKFKNFSGEIGVKYNNNMLRFVYQNVALSEEHLSSNFAKSVDGENVRGLMKTYEILYGKSIYKNVNLSISAGYADDFYEHTILNADVENRTMTIGLVPGYRESNLFNIIGLYFNLEVPIRLYFNPLEETYLGNTTVNRHFIVNNIWFFVGYQF
ncbi:MAG TPA: hypothetical protein PLY70_06130 [Saprospiraceae bacterium]|nr:hypothetical protein [Saprospiraceae bacterium]HPN69747.1 hypothetical protein [Saprospiraceae bacterium]